jgi:hypothetical protein
MDEAIKVILEKITKETVAADCLQLSQAVLNLANSKAVSK